MGALFLRVCRVFHYVSGVCVHTPVCCLCLGFCPRPNQSCSACVCVGVCRGVQACAHAGLWIVHWGFDDSQCSSFWAGNVEAAQYLIPAGLFYSHRESAESKLSLKPLITPHITHTTARFSQKSLTVLLRASDGLENLPSGSNLRDSFLAVGQKRFVAWFTFGRCPTMTAISRCVWSLFCAGPLQAHMPARE